MRYIPGRTVRDSLVPPTNDEIARKFGGPVFTFVSQPHLEEWSAGTVGLDDMLTEVSLVYCVYRRPEDLHDASNFIDGVDAIFADIDRAKAEDQPVWFVETLQRMKYPMLWEAVRTVKLAHNSSRPLAERLAEQVNHILINTVESRRRSAPGRPSTLDHEVSASHARSGFSLNIDGTDVDALTIDTDPDVIGWAAEVGDSAVFVAFKREFVGMIDVSLRQRHAPPVASR